MSSVRCGNALRVGDSTATAVLVHCGRGPPGLGGRSTRRRRCLRNKSKQWRRLIVARCENFHPVPAVYDVKTEMTIAQFYNHCVQVQYRHFVETLPTFAQCLRVLFPCRKAIAGLPCCTMEPVLNEDIGGKPVSLCGSRVWYDALLQHDRKISIGFGTVSSWGRRMSDWHGYEVDDCLALMTQSLDASTAAKIIKYLTGDNAAPTSLSSMLVSPPKIYEIANGFFQIRKNGGGHLYDKGFIHSVFLNG